MALPRKLKGFNLYHNAVTFAGSVTEVTLPKLTRKMEDHQGGGMSGPIQIDFGQEAITLEWTCGGFMREVVAAYGTLKHDGVLLRFAGGYQAEDSDEYDAIEITVRGRHKELDFGTAKAKDDSPMKITTACSYYKLTMNGEDLVEIDFINMIQKIDGTDAYEKLRRAIGI